MLGNLQATLGKYPCVRNVAVRGHRVPLANTKRNARLSVRRFTNGHGGVGFTLLLENTQNATCNTRKADGTFVRGEILMISVLLSC